MRLSAKNRRSRLLPFSTSRLDIPGIHDELCQGRIIVRALEQSAASRILPRQTHRACPSLDCSRPSLSSSCFGSAICSGASKSNAFRSPRKALSPAGSPSNQLSTSRTATRRRRLRVFRTAQPILDQLRRAGTLIQVGQEKERAALCGIVKRPCCSSDSQNHLDYRPDRRK